MQDKCRKTSIFHPSEGRKSWNKSVLLLWLWPSLRGEIRFFCTQCSQTKQMGCFPVALSWLMPTGENVDVWKQQIETLEGETQNESPHDQAAMKLLSLSTSPSPNTDLDNLTFSLPESTRICPEMSREFKFQPECLALTSSVPPVCCGTAHNSICIHCIEFQCY